MGENSPGDDPSDREQPPSRRAVLAGAEDGFTVRRGAGTLAATDDDAASTPSTAELLAGLVRRYRDAATVRRAVQTTAGDLLTTLARDGVLESAAESALDLGQPVTAPADEYRDGTLVSAVVVDGTPTGRINVSRDRGDHTLSLWVLPEVGRRYAVVTGDGVTIYDPDRDGESRFDPVETDVECGRACTSPVGVGTDCQAYDVYCGSVCYFGRWRGDCEGSCHGSCRDACDAR